MNEEFVDRWNTFAQSLSDWANQMLEHIVLPVCNAMREAYKQAGSPYGDTQEGLLMWMEVISLQNRREQQEEYKQMRKG